ncbi:MULTISPECIES: alpha/beta hydrolase [Chryseobacterium]|uniref:Acetyl esterase n=2 Tax=Chryseobacterium aquaticum TaxID=452084 RepID=A0A101CKT0_9FLAO|nr:MULTISPECIES: alpha/beta hydrolase [Chryseobacterium]KUJ58043.1 acetyl esterase [Chryseobacterium aquaticum subsp. greenlandense]NMR36054.1 alpha/beta hydrolase [Chryseobacterium aquaticum]NRQ48141.1 alpha/beta hydrolase [Chryseobacterium sp. C-204]
MNKCIGILLLIILFSGCKEKTINLGKDISFDQEMDVSYDIDPQQKLDLYIPKNKDSIKGVFVMIHGGGWKSGNKTNLTFFTLSLMQKLPDYAFANINYRLADANSFVLPNQTNDIDSAIDFLLKKLNTNTKFILLGNSAGAHLSMLYGYNSFLNLKHHNKIKAVVNIVGPADLSDKDFANYSDYNFLEKHMIDLQSQIPNDLTNKDIPNPVYWINKKSPPTISFYGNTDQVIPPSQKRILDSALNKNGIYNQSFEFSGGHLDWEKEKNAQFLIDKIDIFLKKVK